MTNVAFLFPGQGAQDWNILEGLKSCKPFRTHYPLLCDLLGFSPVAKLADRSCDRINQNKISSALTVFASAIALELYREMHDDVPRYVAGYSVGQLTALYAAGCVSLEDMLRLVIVRADLMDQCFAKSKGGMMSAIGLKAEEVETFCLDLRSRGLEIYVSNYNSVGQMSLAGNLEAIEVALEEVKHLKPMKVQRLEVSGAWHCPLLAPAAKELGALLENFKLALPHVPVINNVTGRFFDDAAVLMKRDLCEHLVRPVQWERGIRTLIQCEITTVIEIGYGNMLTKFGKFIDRSLHQSAFYNGLEGK